MKHHHRPWVTRLRRTSQLLFLVGFLLLVVLARPTPGAPASAWLGIYLWLDPLILLATTLATHTLTIVWAGALLVILVTVFAGRVYCGWFCPLGTVHACASHIFWRRRTRREHWSRWQLSKYYILVALLVMTVFGVPWVSVFDPIALLYRTTAVSLWPAVQAATEEGSTAIYQADPGVGDLRVTAITEPTYEWMRDNLFVTSRQAYVGSGLIFGFFVLTVALNFWRRRFWCRYLCPLGALLGLFAWRPVWQRRVNQSACNQCDLCGLDCHGAASDGGGAGWKPAECLGCMNCSDACPQSGVTFSMKAAWTSREARDTVDLGRRGLLGAATAGVAGAVLLGTSPRARGRTVDPMLIRPPGARPERAFLDRCIACGLCMKICPTGGLQPTTFEAGLEGIWTPHLVPQLGYCVQECVRCGEVCPTDAIEALTAEEKQEVRIGLATIDTTRCLPYAYGRDCMVCEEHCPVAEKAIFFAPVTVTDRDGQEIEVLQPQVDPDRCTGCGICENACPFRDRPAIRVTSANESRNPDNQPILPF